MVGPRRWCRVFKIITISLAVTIHHLEPDRAQLTLLTLVVIQPRNESPAVTFQLLMNTWLRIQAELVYK